jgi:hypothetical protein
VDGTHTDAHVMMRGPPASVQADHYGKRALEKKVVKCDRSAEHYPEPLGRESQISSVVPFTRS